MSRILAFFCVVLLLGCSSTAFSTGYAEAGAGGYDATGGASAAGSSSTGGVAGSLVSAAGATSQAGSPAGGAPSTGGVGGVPAGSLSVDVVPGVATDCVFPSSVVLPPLVPDACTNISQNGVCMQCAGDCTLPFVFSDLSWDYSSLTLTLTITTINGGLYAMNQGACGGTLNTCDYQIFFNSPSETVTTREIVFQKTDRGYVGFDVGAVPTYGPSSESCSTDTGFLNRMGCVQGGWTDYWYHLTIPCAK